MALVKTIKDRNTHNTIYPITKADAVYLSDNETTVEGALGDLSTISSIGDGTIAGAISSLNMNLTTGFIIKGYTYTYTIRANATSALTSSNFNIQIPENYIPSGIIQFTSGDGSVYVRGVNISSDASGMIYLKNTTSSAITASAYLKILYIKRNFFIS